MLLSLVAGGVGLNLTGANHLILVDPHWNPQLEAQAFDRVYRVGQSKPVQIYKWVLMVHPDNSTRKKNLSRYWIGCCARIPSRWESNWYRTANSIYRRTFSPVPKMAQPANFHSRIYVNSSKCSKEQHYYYYYYYLPSVGGFVIECFMLVL